jgi:hypothetical protein
MQPGIDSFKWQLDVQVYNLTRLGMLEDNEYHILVFVEGHLKNNIPDWSDLERKNVKVFYYVDDKNRCDHLIKQFNYQPLLRPWMAALHFKKYRELEKEVIFYIDSDIVFTKQFDYQQFAKDDINYLSFTGNREKEYNYISYSYFENKINSDDVAETKKATILNSNIIENLTQLCGITAEKFKEEELNTGGAQYILKNIDYKFWSDVMDGCMMIRLYLSNMNQRYFKGETPQEKENKGFQSWCADMWSILFTLWKRGDNTLCPIELDFAWKNTSLEQLEKLNIYHDAGHHESEEEGVKYDLFNKRKYIKGGTPFEEDLSYISKKHAVSFYITEIQNTKLKHNG